MNHQVIKEKFRFTQLPELLFPLQYSEVEPDCVSKLTTSSLKLIFFKDSNTLWEKVTLYIKQMYCVLRNELIFEKNLIWLHPVDLWLELLMLVVLWGKGKSKCRHFWLS